MAVTTTATKEFYFKTKIEFFYYYLGFRKKELCIEE